MIPHSPTTIEEAVEALLTLLSNAQKAELRGASERDLQGLSAQYVPLIRQRFNLEDKESPLLRACNDTDPINAKFAREFNAILMQPDTAAFVVLQAVQERIRS